MGIDQSMWRQAHYDVTDENNYELKVSTYNITDIAARSTGLDTILMMMSVSIFETDARLYIPLHYCWQKNLCQSESVQLTSITLSFDAVSSRNKHDLI
jgi:hypothetical protein